MPKSKKPRKKHKPQPPKPKVQVIDKVPYCKYCGTETRLATTSELAHLKASDPAFTMDFLFIPECECWEEHPDDWMTI